MIEERSLVDELVEALKPFAEACEHLHPSHADDDLTLDGLQVRDWRAAYAAFSKATALSSEAPPIGLGKSSSFADDLTAVGPLSGQTESSGPAADAESPEARQP